MGLNTISRKSGWYLSEITGSFSSFKKIIIANKESMDLHKIKSGTYIRIKSFKTNEGYEKFIILPFQKDMNENYKHLLKLLKGFSNHKPLYAIDENYLKDMNQLVATLYNNRKSLRFNELLLDIKKKQQKNKLQIGVPEFWLMKNGLRLGEQVLLRNDHPSPIIF